jgi:hypothetical protein
MCWCVRRRQRNVSDTIDSAKHAQEQLKQIERAEDVRLKMDKIELKLLQKELKNVFVREECKMC